MSKVAYTVSVHLCQAMLCRLQVQNTKTPKTTANYRTRPVYPSAEIVRKTSYLAKFHRAAEL